MMKGKKRKDKRLGEVFVFYLVFFQMAINNCATPINRQEGKHRSRLLNNSLLALGSVTSG